MGLKWKRMRELAAVFFAMVKKDGLGATLRRALGFLRRRFASKKGRFLPAGRVLDLQREQDFSGWPVLSLLLPLFNTPQPVLSAVFESVMGQTCPCWQLCIVDASDDAHKAVGDTVRILCGKDQRVIYRRIENRGIAENTNAAAALATGEYLGLLDHDDVLAPHAVYEMLKTARETGAAFLYSDEALFDRNIKRPITGHFKPDFSPDYLNCCNYICHFAVFRKSLFEAVGGMDPACEGSQDHDLFLKFTEHVTPVHIPLVLYYWRVSGNSTSSGTQAKPYVAEAAKRAIAGHLSRTGAAAAVTDGLFPSTYRVEYKLPSAPLVSILIPNKDHAADLSQAVHALYEKTAYPNFETIIIDNNSEMPEMPAFYVALQRKYKNLRIIHYKEKGFNFSAINNFGRSSAHGAYMLLLNNDVQPINPAWLNEMVALGVQKGVGIVGAKLYYPDDTIQHAGVITGLGGYAGHSHKYARRDASGYMFRLSTVQNFSAVTAACMLVKTSVYDEAHGLDEGFAVAFNDVDFCLRVRALGYRVLYTPYAELYHHESKTRGLDTKGPAKDRFESERQRLKERWGDALLHDPFYNPNLTLDREDFSESDVLPDLA